MSAATDTLYNTLRAAGKIPGWNITRLDTGAYRVASPTGMALIPATPTPGVCAEALATLDTLGLQHDLHHRLLPAPPAPVQTEPTLIPDTETEPIAVPPATAATTSGITLFEYPKKPQLIPLDQLLPAAFKRRKTRLLVPRVVVDATIAEAFFDLRADEKNRKLRPSNRARFARLITEGQFDHTHQGLAFNTDGLCADGQHRLAALLEIAEDNPDVTMVVDITYNAPVDSARNYDGGANRSAVDHLQVAGMANAKQLSQLVRLLYLYETGLEKKVKSWKEIPPISQTTLIDWSDRYGDDLLECLQAVRTPLRGTRMHMHVAAVGRYLAREQWEKSPIDEFVEALGEPTKLTRNSPQRALSTWLNGNYLRNKRTTPQVILAMFLVAYNDFCADVDRAQMKWLPSSGMPLAYAPGSADGPSDQ
jgi:hypothetical protein